MSTPRVERFDLVDTPLRRGTNLLEASAGTGKTHTIAGLFVRLVLEAHLTVDQILVVTFTEAATAELRQRIHDRLRAALGALQGHELDDDFLRALVRQAGDRAAEQAAQLECALGGFDEVAIHTIHGFCQRTLRDRAFESGAFFDVELLPDESALRREVVEDYWRQHFHTAPACRLAFALAAGLSVSELEKLFRECAQHPDMEVLWPVANRSLAELEQEVNAAFETVQTLWLSQRGQIRSCFGSATKWGKKPYNRDEPMAERFAALDRGLMEGEPDTATVAALEEFRQQAILAGARENAKVPPPRHPFFAACETLCAAADAWLKAVQADFLSRAREALAEHKQRHKVQDYTDLLVRVRDALRGPAGEALATALQQKYRAALIDEFQDTDPVQYEIFQRVFGGPDRWLYLIGDPKQAIYDFRGADIFTYLKAARAAQRRYTLAENWRSESGLVHAVNTLFDARPRAFVFPEIQFLPVTPRGRADTQPLHWNQANRAPFRFWFCRRSLGNNPLPKGVLRRTLPDRVAEAIVRLLQSDARIGERPVRPTDIAVLVMTNREAEQMQAALQRKRVPAVLHTESSVWATREARDLFRVLAAVAQPRHEALRRGALATAFEGWSGDRLAAMTQAEAQAQAGAYVALLEMWEQHGFFRFFRAWLVQRGVRARVLAFPDGERRLTNLLHLGELLHAADVARRPGVGGLLKWLGDQLQAQDGPAAEEAQLRLESDENAVRLITVHKSKGLQYGIVFCPFCWRGSALKPGQGSKLRRVRFHPRDGSGRSCLDLGGPEFEAYRQLAEQERLAENVRLMYVAVTRAIHRCVFVWGGIKDAGSSAPAWLFHHEPNTNECSADTLQDGFKLLTDDQMLGQLQALADRAGGNVTVEDLPASAALTYQPSELLPRDAGHLEFTGNIRRGWGIASFSWLISGQPDEKPDHDRVAPLQAEEAPATGRFAFPRGVRAGTCLHKIFEVLDFTSSPAAMEALIEEQLRAHHLLTDAHREGVREMVANALRLPLDTGRPGFSLAHVPPADCLKEMEFYFPIGELSRARLSAALEQAGLPIHLEAERADSSRHPAGTDSPADRDVGEPLSRPADVRRESELTSRTVETSAAEDDFAESCPQLTRGFMKGFVDLIFRCGDRYFILDWKSNWLGNRAEDYHPDALRDEMALRHYYLQYHLYSVALHKHLARCLPGYDYEQHFGGVFYLFLRGLDPARPQLGVFRDRPTRALVRQLETLLDQRAPA